MPVQGLHECLIWVVMCLCAARRSMTDLVGEDQKDVISIGKCYSLRGLFTLINHTQTNTQSIMCTPMQTQSPFAPEHPCRHFSRAGIIRQTCYGTQNAVWQINTSTHHLLQLVCLCWFADKFLVIQPTVCFYNRLAVPGLFCSPAWPPSHLPRTCKRSRYNLPAHCIPMDPHKTQSFASQPQPFCDAGVDYSWGVGGAFIFTSS